MYNTEETLEIKQGDNVKHTIFGEGVVTKINGDLATIAFKYGIGVKTIAINHKYLSKIDNH